MPSSLVTPEHHVEEKGGKNETDGCEALVSASVWLVSVKLKSASVHHTQEVKRERRGEAHRLSDLNTGGRSEEKLLNTKEQTPQQLLQI